MRPNPQEGLVDRQTDFCERSTALHVAQDHALSRHLLPRGCAFVGSPPSSSEGVLCQVLG